MNQKDSKKTLIFHDTFLYKGGGERLIIMMGKALNADIASGFFSKGSFNLESEGFLGKKISVSSEVFTKGLRHLKLKYAFLFKSSFLKEYETVIFSGDSISAVKNCSRECNKIYYCHTPPRYLYDLHDLYLDKVNFFFKPVFSVLCIFFRFLYKKDISKIDLIVTNSINTQERIKKYLGYESIVLYPPVDTSKFVPGKSEGYFLSFARLSDAKRVDMVVQAFREIKDEKLIVIYGKNDPQREKVFSLAEGCSNIQCITLDNNDDLYGYIAKTRATIYVPIDEDFGMSPIESMSAGKPVLGVNDGGLKETIIHEETGYLTKKELEISDIVYGVKYLNEEKCAFMKEACIEQSKKFSLDVFEKQLKKLVK